MNIFTDRWLLIIDKLAEGKKTAFAEKMGMTKQTLNAYITREKLYPGGEVLERLDRLGVNINWFLTGDGPMMKLERILNIADKLSEENERLKAENELLKKAIGAIRLTTESVINEGVKKKK